MLRRASCSPLSGMNRPLKKEKTILAVVDRLRCDLGEGTFDVGDHWEGDLCAIGLAMPCDHSMLVYISSFGHPDGQYSYETELPPGPDTDGQYATADRSSACNYDDLLKAIKKHWKLETA